VTGAVGDVFAKLTFDEEFIDRRQQQKAAPPKLGSKLGGFAKVPTNQKYIACLFLYLSITLVVLLKWV